MNVFFRQHLMIFSGSRTDYNFRNTLAPKRPQIFLSQGQLSSHSGERFGNGLPHFMRKGDRNF